MTAVLLIDGEGLLGAKQNRILNTSVLVGPGQRVTIPVSCVERGRWAYRNRRFASGGRTLYPSVSRKKAVQVHASLLRHDRRLADQHDLWTDLSEKARTFGVSTSTEAMRDVFEAREADLRAYRTALSPQPGQVGALVYRGRAWWDLDLVPASRLFAGAGSRLLTGYAVDALLLERQKEPIEDAAERLAKLTQVHGTTTYPGIGLGDVVRFDGPGFVGTALVTSDCVAHLMAFPA
jgi:hypothetical protein